MKNLLVLSGLLLLASAQAGHAANWLVERVSGAAWAVAQGREQIRLQPRMVVAEGVTIATGASGRVRLVSDGNAMMVAPNTRTVVVPGASPRETFVVQQAGQIEFDIQKRGRPHFTLQTPYLAAVMKGTRFTVSVTGAASTIDVRQGLVSVRDLRSGQTAEIGANQQASVRANVAGLQTAGPVAPGVFQGTPTPPAVAPVGLDHGSFRSDRAPDQASPSTGAASTRSGVDGARSGAAARSGGLGGLGGRSNGGSGENASRQDRNDAADRDRGNAQSGWGRGNAETNARGSRGNASGDFGARGNDEGRGKAFGRDGNDAADRSRGNARSGGGRGDAQGASRSERGGGPGGQGNGVGNAGASGNAGGDNANAGANGNAAGGSGNNGNAGANGNAGGNASNAGGNGNGVGNAGGGNAGGNGNGGANGSAGGGNAGGNGNGRG